MKTTFAAGTGNARKIMYCYLGGIYVMNADGSGKTFLRNGSYPVWSPDGTKIAFLGSDFNFRWQLFVMNADGGGFAQITFINGTLASTPPAWSPDSTRLAFSVFIDSNGSGGFELSERELHTVNANGTGLTRLTNNVADDLVPQWSPDGLKIAFGSDRSSATGTFDVYVMNADGSGVARLTTTPDRSGYKSFPSWSPDGLKIAYDCEDYTSGKYVIGICVMGVGGGGQAMVTDGTSSQTTGRPTITEMPNWSNDSSHVSFTQVEGLHNGSAVFRNMVVNVDGGATTRIGAAKNSTTPDWSPDDAEILFHDGTNIFSLKTDTNEKVQLTSYQPGAAETVVSAPQWQPSPACDCPVIPRPTPAVITGPSVEPGKQWQMQVEVTENDGLVLRDVKLGERYMAKQLSVPYLVLETSAFAKQRGELKPSSADSSMRSRLIGYEVKSDIEKLVVEATYLVDQIPASSRSCVHVTQRYEFYKQGVLPCEPTEKLPCARWKPIVKYKFFGRHGETLRSVNIPQRQHLSVNGNQYNTVGIFRDCDIPGTCLPNGIVFERKFNPLSVEFSDRLITGGQDAKQWDNYHQTYLGYVDEPGVDFTLQNWSLKRPGCPECAHSHWRWGVAAGGEGLGNLIGIPPASKQDLEFSILRYKSGEEDPQDVKDIYQHWESIRTFNTAGRNKLQIYRHSAPEEVVYWYSATGYQNRDAFFGHGGFYNPSAPNVQIYGGSSVAAVPNPEGAVVGVAADTHPDGSAPADFAGYKYRGSRAPFTPSANLEADGLTSVVAADLYMDGPTAVEPFDPSLLGPLPPGYTAYNSLGYEVETEAEVSGPHTVTFNVASVTDPTVFANLRVFHGELDSTDPDKVVWVDRTVLQPDPQAPDFSTRTLTARANFLGPFVVASLTQPQPPNAAAADLAVSSSDSPDPVMADGNLTYTLTVTNSGPQAATDITLTDYLPPHAALVSATASAGDCNEEEGGVICKPGTLAAGANVTVTVTVKPTEGGRGFPPGGSEITNSAHVAAAESDPDPTNNVVTQSTNVLPNSNLAPSVSVTGPSAGSVFVGPANVTVSAVASDSDGTVSRVDFYDDGTLIGAGTTTDSTNFTFAWGGAGFGKHSLVAVATDSGGRTAASSPVNIIVNGTATVSIASPAAWSEFTAPANITVTASAFQNGGSIQRVDFYADVNLIGTGTPTGTNQYSVTWNGAASGRYSLTAVAVNSAGVSTTSKPVPVDVFLRVNAPPDASITSPANNAVFVTPANITLTANAADDRAVSRVDFHANGTVIGTGTRTGTSQYNFTWGNVARGSYTLTAVATDDEGKTTTSSGINVRVTTPALLVVGSTALTGGDSAVRNRMTALGYTVTVKDGTTAAGTDATGKAVVVISSTVSPTSVGTKFRNVTVPVVTWESGLYANMGMTGSTSKDFGTVSRQTQVSIIDPAHPLAANLSGAVTVVTASGTFDWGKPNTNAARVATVAGDATKTAIFGYNSGAAMPGLAAPAKRVGLFLHDTTAAGLTPGGWALFDAAINWATGLAPLP